jgi:hypothetical protein
MRDPQLLTTRSGCLNRWPESERRSIRTEGGSNAIHRLGLGRCRHNSGLGMAANSARHRSHGWIVIGLPIIAVLLLVAVRCDREIKRP